MNGYVKKTKPALWTQLPGALHRQEKLYGNKPGEIGGVSYAKAKASQKQFEKWLKRKRIPAKSAEQARRERLYAPLAKWFKERNPRCETCEVILKSMMTDGLLLRPNPGLESRAHRTEHVHHVKGKSKAAYFYFPWFKATCATAHGWIDANREAARPLGLLAPRGEFNTQPTESVWRAQWRGGFTYLAAGTEAEAAAQLPAGTLTFRLTLIE